MLTLKQLTKIKEIMKTCAYCSNKIDYIWLNRKYLQGGLFGFFRCNEHRFTDDPITDSKRYYHLDEKEMFVFHIL